MDPRTVKFRQEYQGKHFFTKDGKEEFVISDARSYGDVTITFINSGLQKIEKISNIKKGLSNPFTRAGVHGEPGPVAFDSYQQQYNGCIYPTNYGGYLQITDYLATSKVYYKFLDDHGYSDYTTMQNIRKGQVRNPYAVNEYNGYIGEGPFKGNERLYNVWHLLLIRAVGKRDKYSQSYTESQIRSYENAKICQEWLCYNTFAQWYTSQESKLNPHYVYEIDKDLLYPLYRNQTDGYKLYSPATCCLLPKDLNVLISNTNKANRQREACVAHLLEMTEFYYKENAMSKKAYNAIQGLYNNGNRHYIDFTRRTDYAANAYRIDN